MQKIVLTLLAFLLVIPAAGQYNTNIRPSDNYSESTISSSLSPKDTTSQKKKKKKKDVQYNEKGEIIKKGLNFGPLPVVAYDADKGFQVGGLLNIFDFGDGSTYPNPRQQWYMEASWYTKGSQLYTLSYDTKFLIPNIRFSTTATMSIDKALDFYGFNGYQSFYDSDRIALGKKKDSGYYNYTPFYRVDRLALLFKADFIGNIIKKKFFWEAGYHLSYIQEGAINRTEVNKGKTEDKKFPTDPTTDPTLYEQYRTWGIISDQEAGGGLTSSIRVGLLYDSRNKEAAPSKGIWAEGHLMLAPKWLGTKNPFYRYSLTFRHYVPIVKNDVLTFAYRLNYEGTIGKSAPYYILPYITNVGKDYDRDGNGGFRTIRGIMRNRIQGLDVGIYTLELRYRFVKFKIGKQNIALALNAFSDGGIVTRKYDMSFKKTSADFATPALYEKALLEYQEYMGKGRKETLHATVGGGFRFIMNENFIVCAEYGLPVGPNCKQDGKGAFYLNVGYLF